MLHAYSAISLKLLQDLLYFIVILNIYTYKKRKSDSYSIWVGSCLSDQPSVKFHLKFWKYLTIKLLINKYGDQISNWFLCFQLHVAAAVSTFTK